MEAGYNQVLSHPNQPVIRMKRSQRIIVIVGLAISAIFLFIAFQGLNPGAVWQEIQQASLPLILIAAAWYFAAVYVISLRWGFLLRAIAPLKVRQLMPLVCICYMGNNVYPLRSGEILRLLLLQRNHHVPFARAAVITVAERVFDGLVMLTFVVIGLLLLNVDSPLLHSVATFAAPVFLIALVVFFVLAAQPRRFRRLVAWVANFLPGKIRDLVVKLADDVLTGLEGFRSPADLFSAIVASYIAWMLEASVYWIVTFAFNLNVDYATALLMVGVVNLAGLIPASPGMVGVFEYAVITVLGLVGIAEANATAYAIVVHLVIWLPVTLVGFILLARQGLNWGAIRRAQDLKQSGELNEGTVVIP